uniref:ChREBP2 n=1 Tax=Paracyclopina nana TaxID=565004 RepID=A0A1L3THU6_PARNA|nr:ChREBP2 [Paracyclopina nana]
MAEPNFLHMDDQAEPQEHHQFTDAFFSAPMASSSHVQTFTPTLTEAILDPDSFLRNFGIHEESNGHPIVTSHESYFAKMEVDSSISTSIDNGLLMTTTFSSPVPIIASGYRNSPNCTPTNASPEATPSEPSRPVMKAEAHRPPGGTFRHFHNGLDTIPEYSVTDPPKVFQPLVPPPVPKHATTTSYNISFPTTLQPRDKFDLWRGHCGLSQLQASVANGSRYSSGTGSSCSSSMAQSPGSSVTSPFHDATVTSPLDVSEFQPLNVIEDSRKGFSTRMTKVKPNKRSRTNSPSRGDDNEDLSDGASSRQRRRSNNLGRESSESKRRDSIKCGLEDLQRALPQFGTPEEEKISQATILSEAAKYLKSLRRAQDDGLASLESINREIEAINQKIEQLQDQLPDHGATFTLDKKNIMPKRSLQDQFADHVVDKTHQNWKYWVFTSIMGHFVHSFAQEVSATSHQDLQTTSLEWITNSMSLQQLRKDVSRKLAKLCAKTSISEDPSKLPEEALKFVSSSVSRRQSRQQQPHQIDHHRPSSYANTFP